jgi:hypothetical protein
MTEFAQGLGEVAFAVHVLDEEYLTHTDGSGFAVARCDLVGRVQVDDVLAPRRRMPVKKPISRNGAEITPEAGNRFDVVPSGPASDSSISMSRKCVSPFSSA